MPSLLLLLHLMVSLTTRAVRSPRMIGYEAAVQVGVVKTVGRTPSEGLGVPEGHDSVPTCEEGLRKCCLVHHHLEGKHRDQIRLVKCQKGPSFWTCLSTAMSRSCHVAHVQQRPV